MYHFIGDIFMNEENLIKYYNKFNEDKRLNTRHGQVEFITSMKYIKEYYQAASEGLFTLATPVLAGLGTPTKQFSSCVLIKSDDDLDSIFACGEMMAKYASKRAGIGLEVGRLRSLRARSGRHHSWPESSSYLLTRSHGNRGFP